ncbi:MAG TPA: polymer-forming cytoskeletal protein [Thermoanaerobaculia bacterium]|nr:polymer-forming cytoskeletal protein [Thermoanaerobaculia bacterium]
MTPAIAAPAPQSAANPPASAEERTELRRSLESRYEVLPVTGGIALKPRKARAGIRTIEVMTGQDVAVNGERVSARTLRDWLGEDADALLRLRGLSAAEQRQLFGLEDGASAAEPSIPEPAAETETSVEEVAATTSDVDVDVDVAEVPEVPEPPAPPETPERERRHNAGPRVNVGGSVRVDKDEVVEEAVAVGGSATVDGEVTDTVTAIGGAARIQGKVGGDVTSVGSSVFLGPNAVVEGDVTAVGGTIHREPGSQIHGVPTEVGLFPWRHRGRMFDDRWGRGPWSFWGGFSDVMGSVVGLILIGLLTCLVLLVARRPLERVDRQLAAQPWQSALAGLLGTIFFWPLLLVVTVLLAITVVGCALFLLYPFLFLYLVLLFILGYAAVAYRLGRLIEIRFNRRFGGPYMVALVGVALIQVWSLLGEVFDVIPWFGFFAFMLGLFGALVQAIAWIVGFGAVILSRFGLEPGYWPQRGAPVPPPSYTPPPPVDFSGDYSGDYSGDRLPLSDPLTGPEAEPEIYPEVYPPEEPEPPR